MLFFCFLQPMLTDNRGFAYHQKFDKRRAHITWRCTHRSAPNMCKATVLQKNNQYVMGGSSHTCKAQPNREVTLLVKREARARGQMTPRGSFWMNSQRLYKAIHELLKLMC